MEGGEGSDEGVVIKASLMGGGLGLVSRKLLVLLSMGLSVDELVVVVVV